MVEYYHLSHLTHLSFIKCEFRNKDKNILNNIWNLPKLIHCHLDIYFTSGYDFIFPSIFSSSLEYLFIKPYCCDLHQLSNLFLHTPHLRYLCTRIENDSAYHHILSTIPSITMLNISIDESPYPMLALLENVPNLCYLTIDMIEIIMNGHSWEQLITKYLFKLKIFRFNMNFDFPNDDTKEQRIDELLDTFRTSFWHEERKWFVRCDWDRCPKCDNSINLYSLSYISNECFHCQSSFRSKSTCPNTNNAWSYKHMRNLVYINNPSSNIVSPDLRFSNVRYLEIDFPVDDKFWYCIQNYNQLTSLVISWNDDSDDYTKFDQVQILLDRTSHLNSLTFQFSLSSSTQFLPIKYTSKSVRRLNLLKIDQFFDDQQCTLLSQSSLGIQCEILSITVTNRTNVINLINTMINLRVLNVLCQDDTQNNDDQSSALADELVEWLKHHLPSTCTITRSKHNTYSRQLIAVETILIWIR